MNTILTQRRSFASLALAAAVGLGTVSVSTPAANALSAEQQIFSGGGSFGGASPVYTSPGFSNIFGPDFPSAGAGESSTQLNMLAGVASRLKVRVHTATVPSSGSLTLTIRRNGKNTALSCTVTGSGTCSSSATVNYKSGKKLSVQITNDFVGSGVIAFQYTLLYD